MERDERRLYKALAARDPRFDGVFFVAVTSTGIYCRPICPVKTPKAANCRFFDTAQESEQAGFRPCLRCRPELAPGSAPIDDSQRIAQLIVQRLEEGKLDEKAGLEEIADQFELSSRQIRRIVQKELGVPPIQLLLTRRLHEWRMAHGAESYWNRRVGEQVLAGRSTVCEVVRAA